MTRYQPSTRNTMTSRAQHGFIVVTLIGVLAVLIVLAVIGHDLVTTVQHMLDTMRAGNPGSCVGGAA
jgi:Tfp pilus assembly protein PilX